MKNCLVAQSGGPTAAVNASLAGVIRAAMKSEKVDRVFGGRNGISGVLKEVLSFFTGRIATGIIDIAIMVVFVDMLLCDEFVMKIIANVVVIILNFIISKLWVFGK